jgi:hypothetical protein
LFNKKPLITDRKNEIITEKYRLKFKKSTKTKRVPISISVDETHTNAYLKNVSFFLIRFDIILKKIK